MQQDSLEMMLRFQHSTVLTTLSMLKSLLSCSLFFYVSVHKLTAPSLFVVEQTDRGAEFRRSHHVVRKTSLYDMGVDPTCKYAAVGCQDRCIRYVSSLL